MLDEPFANIDPIAVHDVKQMIRLLARKNISVLITDHNAREIFSIVDRSYIVRPRVSHAVWYSGRACEQPRGQTALFRKRI